MQADPEIIVITREPGDKKIVGEEWHTETTMMAEPPMGAILCAIAVPPYGGDTLLANQYQAYAALSDGMKKMLESVRAVHSDRKVAGRRPTRMPTGPPKCGRYAPWRETVSTHPVVVTHPETKRKLLCVNASYTMGFAGNRGGEPTAARHPDRRRAAGVKGPAGVWSIIATCPDRKPGGAE